MAFDDFLLNYPESYRKRARKALSRLPNAPTLSTADFLLLIQHAAGVSASTADVIYSTILAILSTAIRNRRRLQIPNFGTFTTTRRASTGYYSVRFHPIGEWWGDWMPVAAYNADFEIIGIWSGSDLLPFGHPDNPYASPSEIPFVPDWSWKAATPLPGEAAPRPYPHPIRPRKGWIDPWRKQAADRTADRKRKREIQERKKREEAMGLQSWMKKQGLPP